MSALEQIAVESWTVWTEAAPWLALGLVAAGLMKAWFPMELVQRWLGGSGFWPSVRAAVIGTPLPLCSCSVLPTAIQLRRSGASRSSTVSFLIATPENGLDSLSMSWVMLGPWMTLARLVGALISSITAGWLTSWIDRESAVTSGPAPDSVVPAIVQVPGGTGLLKIAPPPTPVVPPRPTVVEGVRYAFTRLLSDISLWLLFGVASAAVIQVLVPPDSMASFSRSPFALLLVLAVSVPTYVCASASTPIAASLMSAGLSPGAALVFLLAGPATNLSSAMIVRRELGPRALAGYLFGVIGVTLALGFAVDRVFPGLTELSRAHVHEHTSGLPAAVANVIAVVLLARLVWARATRK